MNKSKYIRELEREVERLERKVDYYQTNYKWAMECLKMVKDAWSIAHPIDVAYMHQLGRERERICDRDHYSDESKAVQEIMKHPDFYTQLMGEWGRPLPNGKVARRGESFELAESYRREQLELRIERMRQQEQEATDVRATE